MKTYICPECGKECEVGWAHSKCVLWDFSVFFPGRIRHAFWKTSDKPVWTAWR